MSPPGPHEPRVFAVTDCGSTTTKAILIEERGGAYRCTHLADAPTTVEAPFEDVTIGVRRAMTDLGRASGRHVLNDSGALIRPASDGRGVDAHLSTSSAGGGLQMAVLGLVEALSARSARAAALGAGAIVVDTIAFDDRRTLHEQMERLRALRPDIVLLAGGTDGGADSQVLELAEILAAASPVPRAGSDARLPVLYAGNAALREAVSKALGDRFDVFHEDNVRPEVDRESLQAARGRIHELFLEHVMRRAPGFQNLSEMVDAPIAPTPFAVGRILGEAARHRGRRITCVDIGGATTDIFTVEGERVERTVSANLGMSYSAANVLREAGLENVTRWMPEPPAPRALQDQVLGKTVRPTTLPATASEVSLEHAMAREAIRLAYEAHRAFVGTGGGARGRLSLGRAFARAQADRETAAAPGLIVGSGGVLSHAPQPEQTAAVLIDAFLPIGVTELAKDEHFILPHLGALLEVDPRAALEVFERDGLTPLGVCVAPLGSVKGDKIILEVEVVRGSKSATAALRAGQLLRLDAPGEGPVQLRLSPGRGFDVGAGSGRLFEQTVDPGSVGIVLDGRGRPALDWPADPDGRRQVLPRWLNAWGKNPGGGR